MPVVHRVLHADDPRADAPRSSRLLKVRWAGVCCLCHAPLAVGTRARWDSRAHTFTCADCLTGKGAVQGGPAGGSAAVEAERRRRDQADQQARRKREHPLRARVSLALSPEPDAGREYAAGALGEARLGALLDGLRVVGAITLHDRKLPRSKANLDHLVITAAGVWVIDAKRAGGPLSFAARGRPGPRQAVVVQGRPQSTLLTKLQGQVDRVIQALAAAGVDEVPVRGALCFVDAQPVEGQRPVEARGLLLTWSEQLQPVLLESGPYDDEDKAALLRLLARSFAPAT
jgi:hypothetical protein